MHIVAVYLHMSSRGDGRCVNSRFHFVLFRYGNSSKPSGALTTQPPGFDDFDEVLIEFKVQFFFMDVSLQNY